MFGVEDGIQETVVQRSIDDVLQAAPEVANVLKRVEDDDGAEGAVGKGEVLDIGDLIHPWSRPRVDAEVRLPLKEGPQLRDLFLPLDLVGADFQNGLGQIEGLSDGAGHAVQKVIHGCLLAGTTGSL